MIEIRKRESSYDILRIISTVAVIAIHVNAGYLQTNIQNYAGDVNITWIIENLINFITRFSVPCFVMLSGAFVLHNKKTSDYKSFYRKSFFKIGVPFLVMCIAWIIVYGIKALLTGDIIHFLEVIIRVAYVNLWFMPMLIGLYFIAPLIVKLKGEKQIPLIIGMVLLIWAVVSQSTSEYKLPYSLGIIISYMSYFIIGNILYESTKKINSIYVVFGIIIVSVIGTLWRCGNHQFFSMEYYRAFFSPLVVILSISIFLLFKQISINSKIIEQISNKTYYAYLLHTPILIFIQYLFDKMDINELSKIFIEIVVVSVMSFFVSDIYKNIINKIICLIKCKIAMLDEKRCDI